MIGFLKRHKRYVTIFGILFIYLIVMVFIAYKLDILNKKYANIIIDGVASWEYKERKWNNIYEYDYLDDDTLYKVYSNNNYYGEYTLGVNNDTLYAFDSSYNSLQYTGSIMAYTSNYDIDVLLFDYVNIDDNDRLILNETINNNYGYNLQGKKILSDLDNDDINEILYIVNFYNNNNIVFSGIYVYDDDSLKEIVNNDSLSEFIYNVEYILDVDNDDNYEVVISLLYEGNITYNVYKKSRGKYKLFLQ